MAPPKRFSINSSRITHETIDEEVVIVNLASGSYYSLNGVGADIWACLAGRASLEEIVQYVAQKFGADLVEVAKAVNQLADTLLAEGLILVEPENGQANNHDGPSFPPSVSDGSTRGQFSPPTLQKYTDMQDLLLLDPIHDVDEAGWPTVKPNSVQESDTRKEDGIS